MAGLIAFAVAALVLAHPPPATPEITIGLFIPTRGPDAAAGSQAEQGAVIAIDRASVGSGTRSTRFRLVVASSDGPWDAATRSLVNLIYEEGAVAVVGALDARTAHVAEQVITRAHGQAVFLTPWASEPGLTRIMIPWFFSVVPDDRRQAEALVAAVYSAGGVRRAALWVEDALDPRSSFEAFLREAPPGSTVAFHAGDPRSRESLASGLRAGEFDALLPFASPEDAAALLGWLRSEGLRLPVFGPLSLCAPGFTGAGEAVEGARLLAPAAAVQSVESEFVAAFATRHGTAPSPIARFAHDAVAIVVKATRNAETVSAKRIAEILPTVELEGATGVVRFETRRGRAGSLSMAEVRAGSIVPIEPVPAARP